MTAVRNMALQHHEFELRLRDAKRLRLFVQASMAEREMRGASLKKAELECRRLELEAKESADRAARAEVERDTALHEAAMARLVFEGDLNTRVQIEAELARVQNALALAEEARRGAEREHVATQEALAEAGVACKKAEEENDHLAVEKLPLVIELGALKDEYAAFQEKAAIDRESLEAEFDSSCDTLFNYGYGCCAFAHNICGSKPEIPVGMPNPSVPLTAEFFANPRCPSSTLTAASAPGSIVVIEEDSSAVNLPTTGEEAGLSTNGEEVVLLINPPTG